MKSLSTHSITWATPDPAEEEWEFLKHPAKQAFYQTHAISWERILSRFEQGALEPYPRSGQLNGIPVRLSYPRYDDYLRYVVSAKRGYRLGYSRMEKDLQREGCLTLPAPIVLQCGEEALLFSGYRRLCLAWNYGMTPAVWLVQLK